MSKKPKDYNREEREAIAKLSLDPETKISALAKRFGVSANSIYGWRRRYLKTSGLSTKEKQALSEAEAEIKQLKKALRQSELEREILKKALSIFSKSDRKCTDL